MTRLAAASSIGTTLEWYDFVIYNVMAALVFNKVFFPSFDPLAGTLLAFSTYAVGYISRPLGGFVFGHLGDRLGRRFVQFAHGIFSGGFRGMRNRLFHRLAADSQPGVVDLRGERVRQGADH